MPGKNKVLFTVVDFDAPRKHVVHAELVPESVMTDQAEAERVVASYMDDETETDVVSEIAYYARKDGGWIDERWCYEFTRLSEPGESAAKTVY